MNKKVIYLIITCVLLSFCGLNTLLLAEAPTKYAQAGMPFLQIDVGSRVGMGGTQLGIIGDAEAMFANPAAMATTERIDLFASNTNWFADIKHYALGLSYNAGALGVFGVNAVFMDYGELRRTYPYDGLDPDLRNKGYIQQGTFSPSEYAIGVSYARQITSQFFVGGNIKYATQDLGSIDVFDEINGVVLTGVEQNVNNLALDIGTIYYPGWKDLRFGVSFRNFADQSDYYNQRFELPLTFDFGLAMDLLKLSQSDAELSNHTLTLALDWIHPRDYDERQHIGVQYGFMETFYLRGGYKVGYDEQGLTAGVGFKKDVSGAGLKVDFVYQDFGIFDNVTRINVGLFLK
jgi:hypothetical protein